VSRTSTELAAAAVAEREAVLAVTRRGVAELRRSRRVAVRVLSAGRHFRAALVPIQAGPLAGDHDVVRLHVGEGVTLELVPVAATLALPGDARTRLELRADVAGRLILDEPPLIVPAGSDVVRLTHIVLAEGAVAAWRDTVILGRAGEGPGRLNAATRVTLAGAPLLHETLRIDPEANDAYVSLPPGHRVVGTVARLGVPGNLAGTGDLQRATSTAASEVEAHLRDAWLAARSSIA
jgi:urease accessory protein UreH